MRTKYLNIELDKMSPSGKTAIYTVTGSENALYLGDIRWYGAWRQYVFFPGAETVFNPECLGDIADFCAGATERHKTKVRLTG